LSTTIVTESFTVPSVVGRGNRYTTEGRNVAATTYLSATTTDDKKEDDDEWETTEEARTNVEKFLSKEFPSFYQVLCSEDNIWKTLNDSPNGYTLFAPNEEAFRTKLDDKRRAQLTDPRNQEAVQKIGLYHVIDEQMVTKESLLREDWRGPKPEDGSPRPFVVGGIQTLGGEVPVGRAKSGGIDFGPINIGGKEDGDAVIGPNARILKSYSLGKNKDTIVHEMDNLISPELLWRYFDQLRLPFSS